MDEVNWYRANLAQLEGALASAREDTGQLLGGFRESRKTWDDSAAKQFGKQFMTPLQATSAETLNHFEQYYAQLKGAEPMMQEMSSGLEKAMELAEKIRDLLDRSSKEKEAGRKDKQTAENLVSEAESATTEAKSILGSAGSLPKRKSGIRSGQEALGGNGSGQERL